MANSMTGFDSAQRWYWIPLQFEAEELEGEKLIGNESQEVDILGIGNIARSQFAHRMK
jgi:hypothetical protein